MAAAVLTSGGISTYNQLAAARILLDALAEQGRRGGGGGRLTPAQPAQMPAELTQLSGWYGTSTAAAQLQITDEGVLTLTGMEGTFTYREDGSFRDESDSVLLKLVQEGQRGDLPLSEELRLHSRPDHPLCGLLRHGAPAQLPAGRGHSGRLGG